MKVEVVEIYPYPNKGIYLERGSVHLFIKDLGLDIKNVPYHIKEEKTEKRHIYHVHVSQPYCVHKQPKEDGSIKAVSVPTITFRDKHTWKEIKKVIQQEVLNQFDPQK